MSNSRLEHERALKDSFFKHDPMSPLTPEQQAAFKGLAYYPENDALRFEVQVEPIAGEPYEMQTSTGDTQVYLPAARATVTISDTPVTLTLYRGESSGPLDYFIPFRDATSGKETYGAGRYLEASANRFGRVVLDFNEAYNPYCAYNEQWSCPLPPAENWLPVPVEAGEKNFPGTAH